MRYVFVIMTLTLVMCTCINCVADTFGSGRGHFEIEFVTIGDPGNAADTSGFPDPSPAGSVNYVYDIAKFEISRDMIQRANADGGLGITLDNLDFVPGGPRPEMPASGVTWNEAARFVNWLNTSKGLPAAYKFNTHPGDVNFDANANIELWVDGELGFDAANPFRNSKAQYALPNAHEWYKAAYYDPSANGGSGGYWNFATGKDTQPFRTASGTDPNTAVYLQPTEQGPADIMKAGGLSAYGVMGLGGNVWEWEETEVDLTNDDPSDLRGLRGGLWFDFAPSMSKIARGNDNPVEQEFYQGFRVVRVPEPNCLLMVLLSTLGLLSWRSRISSCCDVLRC